ncbi:MAG: hypothetical protein CVU61_12540 [Deltaproteobacteria bacterium HGW-Deltaproteobacteria-19]|jgi:hypothetical protein|nr:MAG: hypothetical protein CVU61_12540 [Deltaproteobacteria bacterium HGW-Deltaproteobacteria-19]
MKEQHGEIEQKLVKAIFDVFEKMYYLYLEPLDGEESAPEWLASISFTGVLTGCFEALFSEEIAAAMVENSLLLEGDDVTDALREDCLKECVNMICGSFLRLVDSDRIAHLTLPSCSRTKTVPPPGAGGEAGEIRLRFEADGMQVLFRAQIS